MESEYGFRGLFLGLFLEIVFIKEVLKDFENELRVVVIVMMVCGVESRGILLILYCYFNRSDIFVLLK